MMPNAGSTGAQMRISPTASETPTTGYRVPFFSVADGRVSCRYNRHWLVRALERNGHGFTPEDAALLDPDHHSAVVAEVGAQHRARFSH